ncbi:MAG: hypothetical protein LBI04_01475, partial [Treponema sp.]|nr:hypothetical protein [Treponema sp.]
MYKYRLLFVFAFIWVVFLGCEKSLKDQPNLVIANISFKDIPGVTANEINAIEALRTQYDSFVFGT